MEGRSFHSSCSGSQWFQDFCHSQVRLPFPSTPLDGGCHPSTLVRIVVNFLPSFRHGAQNAYDSASKATLENEFGTSNEDVCMTKILENGDLQHTEVSQHWRRLLQHNDKS